MKFDYLVVGAGFYGSICAHELRKAGKNVCVIDSRNHIGGNCHTTQKDDINLHTYGPHIFHTSNKEVWDWINQFANFNNFRLEVVANFKGEIFPLPFNMWTFNKMWGVTTPEQAQDIIMSQSEGITTPQNLEEQAIQLVGRDIYEKLIKGYTIKQWRKHPRELPASIIKRLPVRFTYNNNYFNETYQGIPIGGYTQIFNQLLDGIEVKLSTDLFSARLPDHDRMIYTGPIDRFFDYKYGALEYKTIRFEHKLIKTENFQGCSCMTFTDEATAHTRIIEHKHFENSSSPVTWISHEYPIKYIPGKTEPYYPVNDSLNTEIYANYKAAADKLGQKFHFGGRLAEYKYYDMHRVIESALSYVKSEIRNTT